MTDKGEFYLVVGSSGEYSSYEMHPVNCFTSEEKANKCMINCESHIMLLKEMRRILESFGYTSFTTKLGKERSYCPSVLIIDSLILTMDPEGSIDTDYEVIKLPIDHNSLDVLMQSISHISNQLDAESRAKFLLGKFDKNGNARPKLTFM